MTEPGHLTDDTVLAMVDGRVEPDARRRIEAHAASCASCRELLSALAREREVSGSGPTQVAGQRGSARGGDVPLRVGRFVPSRVLGAGGMGIVYAARDPELDRVVAVKLLRADLVVESRRAAMEERLRREARAMAKLSHPNVIAVYDVGTHDDRVFIAMEYVDGGTLESWLDTPRPLASVLAAFRAAGSGLAAAHAQGVVHRDFKPTNVLVGGDGRVRVTDFGIAKLEPGAARPSDLGATAGAMGTPHYMAPEQYLGEAVDARADQFSFCVALYDAVYGVRPFAGSTPDELVAAAVAGRITPPPKAVRVPARIHAALVRGLAAEPARRFASLDELLGELVLEPRRWPRRVAVAAAVVAATATGVGAFALLRPHGSGEPARDFTLPTLAGARGHPGPSLAAAFVEPPAPDQLGSSPAAAAWCAPRNAVVIVTMYGRVATVARDGTVTTLGTFGFTTRALGSAVACLASGRIVGVSRGVPFVIDGATASTPGTPPEDVVDAVALGDTARWAGHGALWAWSGSGPAQRVRASCAHPLRISPDGARVACARDQRIVVDTGGAELAGPAGGRAAWARDGRALYVISSGTIRRWRLDGNTAELVASGADPVEVGPWLVVKNHSELVRVWIGDGPAPPAPLIDLGVRAESATLAAAMPPDRAVIIYGERGVRVVALDQPATDFARDRHLATIVALAFSPDGATLYSADAHGLVLARDPPSRRAVAGTVELPEPWAPEPVVVARSDRSLVVGGPHLAGRLADGGFTRWPLGIGIIGSVIGTDDVVAALPREGIAAVGDGQRGALVYSGPLPRGTAALAVDRSSGSALLRADTDLVELLDLRAHQIAFTVTARGKSIQRTALAGKLVAIADASGQVFVADRDGVRPIVNLELPITALAASPVDHRVAVGVQREVVVLDLDRGTELAVGALDSTATALAWSRDGRMLAAAGASTAITIWQAPPPRPR
jgi:tRNA A-37 threonylcarbamoyl transferase component Bud32